MRFCQHCGKEMMDEAVVCPNCGCSAQAANSTQANQVDESVSAGLVVLSFLIPLFGVIYWPVMAKTRPKCAKVCGITALVTWAVWLLLQFTLFRVL